MKIIDFERKGNLVRFYLGADDLEDWYGDDWNDYPYEHNAGTVYERFVSGHRDIVFPFGALVLEPCGGYNNSEYCKDDMRDRRVPCVIAVPEHLAKDNFYTDDFSHWVGADGVVRYYFGDPMEPGEGITVETP